MDSIFLGEIIERVVYPLLFKDRALSFIQVQIQYVCQPQQGTKIRHPENLPSSKVLQVSFLQEPVLLN